MAGDDLMERGRLDSLESLERKKSEVLRVNSWIQTVKNKKLMVKEL